MVSVESLYQHYSQRFGKENPDAKLLAKKYYDRWEMTAQAVACGVAVVTLINSDSVDISAIDPQVSEAFRLAYPSIPLESLATASPEQLSGYVNAWKGKLFEVQVRDQLNAGEEVGGIQLNTDQQAILAESVTQPGWDLQILDSNNSVVEEIQLKATESMTYVRDALERYPEYHVLATNDVSSNVGLLAGLSTAGISEEDLQHAIETSVSEIVNDDVWDILFPGLPFLLIATRQGIAIFSNEKAWSEALASIVAESAKSAIAISGAYVASEIATEATGDFVADVVGDFLADLFLGAILPFGAGFLIRRIFGGGNKPKKVKERKEIPVLNEKIISEWVMPRALLVQRSVAKYYLAPPHSRAPVS